MAAGLPSQHISCQMARRSYSDNDVIVRARRSPRDNPLPPLPPEHTAAHTRPIPDDGWIFDDDEEASSKKSPLSRWRGLTGLFMRRDSSNQSYDGHLPLATEATFQRRLPLQRRETTSPTTGTGTRHSRRPKADGFLRRVNSTRQRGFRRRQTDLPSAGGPHMRTASSTTDSGCPAPETRSDTTHRSVAARDIRKQRDWSSLLKLDIPHVELDRYSIMFEKILSPRVGPPRSSYYIPPSTSTQSLELKPPSSTRNDPTELRDARLLRQSLDVGSSARSAHEYISSPLDRGVPGTADDAQLASDLFQNSASKPTLPPKPKRNPHPLRRSVTSQEVAVTSVRRPPLVTSISHNPYHSSLVAEDMRSDTEGINESSSLTDKHSCNRDRHSGTEVRMNSIKPMQTSNLVESMRHGQRHIHIIGPGNDNTSSVPSAEEEPALSRFIRTHGTAKVAAADGKVSIARQVSITRKQKAGTPIPIRQAARQPVHVKVVNVCGTPAKRKSHHLSLVEV